MNGLHEAMKNPPQWDVLARVIFGGKTRELTGFFKLAPYLLF